MSTSPPPELETIDVAPATRVYLETLDSHGLLQGPIGAQSLQSGTPELLTAIHHILAGGAVSVEIDSPGTASIVDDLNTLLQNALNETNALADGQFRPMF